MDRYAVFGNPIAHSKSPWIHTRFAEQLGENVDYKAVLVDVHQFNKAADKFFFEGGSGINITVPFKVDAFNYASELTARAQTAGAVNTLKKTSGGDCVGDNTDGVGLVRDLVVNLGWQLAGKNILLIGAGGAARGVLQPLMEEGPAMLCIANRSEEKARRLAENHGQPEDGKLVASGLKNLANKFDVVINATSTSLSGEIPAIDTELARDARCYDMMYASEPTPFQAWAKKNGAASTADGLGMLVEQAAEAYCIWRGRQPDTTDVIAHLRATLAASAV